MSNISPVRFVQEVRQEITKVTWPNRKETTTATVMVLVMAIIAAIFFLLADSVISVSVGWILKLWS